MRLRGMSLLCLVSHQNVTARVGRQQLPMRQSRNRANGQNTGESGGRGKKHGGPRALAVARKAMRWQTALKRAVLVFAISVDRQSTQRMTVGVWSKAIPLPCASLARKRVT